MPSSRLLLIVLVCAACGRRERVQEPRPEPSKPPIVPAAVDPQAAITVDGGRITISKPVGFRPESSSRNYLARYVPAGVRGPVTVTVLNGADPPPGIAAVDAANHADFVTAVERSLADRAGAVVIREPPAAVDLGPHKGVVWEEMDAPQPDGSTPPVQRSCVAIVLAGRLYTVEAAAPQGRLGDAGRAVARGVAAGMAAAPPQVPAAASEPGPGADVPAAVPPAAPATSG